MIAIHKYLITDARCMLPMPQGAKILSAQPQGEKLCVWALVNTEQPIKDRLAVVLGTGQDISDMALYRFDFITTTQSGPFVWHIFVEKE